MENMALMAIAAATLLNSIGLIVLSMGRAGMNFHYYRGDDGEIYFDDEPEGGKPEWMEKADRKQRNRRSRKTIKR